MTANLEARINIFKIFTESFVCYVWWWWWWWCVCVALKHKFTWLILPPNPFNKDPQDCSKVERILQWTYNTAAKSLQLCPTLCDPIDGSPPGSPVPGILQARNRSGLPFPSPMHESEKWKWSCSVVSDSSRPHGLQPTRLLRPWDFPGKITGVGCHCLLWHITLDDQYLMILALSNS